MEKAPNFAIDPLLKIIHLGDRIEDRFEIVSKPVRRSHSFAFKVFDHKEGGSKVLLFIPTAVRNDSEALKIIKDYFDLVRLLKHARIARFYDLHADGKFAFIETEYVPGHTLKTIKTKRAPAKFSEEEVKWIAEQILDGLEYAHNQNILHRDLKPANITLMPEKKIKLIDFGISEPIRQALTLVQDTSGLTSILYWSPEQVSGKRLSIRSDIYSLGATLYDLLNGSPPFFRGDVYNCILHKAPEPIDDVSPQMNDLLLKALAKNPDDRFQTCAEMRRALQSTGFPKLHVQNTAASSKPAVREKPGKKRFFSRGSLLKPNLRYPLISALLIVLIAVFLSHLNLKRPNQGQGQPQSKMQQSAKPASQAPLDSFQVKMIGALLSQAQEQIQKGHLVLPKDNNALTLLSQALKIDSTNKGLLSIKAALKNRITEKVRSLLKANQKKQAQRIVSAALRFYPHDADLLTLSRQAAASSLLHPVRIEILNGAGQKGIARQLKNYLQKRGFRVINSENYRVNGRVFWQVAQSKAVATGIAPDSLTLLSSLLGRAVKSESRYQGQNPSATVSIILGKDFRDLKPFKTKSNN